jgi:signal transduction histidine kinase
LDSSKELNTQGIGLGLHISKMIVQQLGGEIICKSKYGFGSSFTFLIALDKVEDSNQ